jgi:pimeloyl-ACP methyl ester carboxylesterase
MATPVILLMVAVACLMLVGTIAPQAAGLWLALERRRAGLQILRADVAGVEMPYLEGGRGDTLVLIHGFGGDKDNFTRIARHLTAHFHLVIPDLPGFGDASREPDARYDVASQVARLHAFRHALGLGRIHLGGNSMGGFIAAQYAATHADSVRSLWLLDAAGFEGAFDTPAIKRYAETGETVLLVRSRRGFDELMSTVMHRRAWVPPAVLNALAERGIRDRPLHERIFGEIGSGSPTLDAVATAISAPTLIVWGRNDRILNPNVAAHMLASIAGSELSLLEGTGHLPMVERPRRVAADFLRFVAARGA